MRGRPEDEEHGAHPGIARELRALRDRVSILENTIAGLEAEPDPLPDPPKPKHHRRSPPGQRAGKLRPVN